MNIARSCRSCGKRSGITGSFSPSPSLPLHLRGRCRETFAETSSSTAPSYMHALSPVAAAAQKGFGPPKPAAPKKEVVVKQLEPNAQCPCGSGNVYDSCCRPYHNNAQNPETPEKLLRSRFSAYTIKNPDFIADTTHPESKEYTGSRSAYIKQVTKTQKRLDCSKLEIVEQQPGEGPSQHFITFKFSYIDQGEKDVKQRNQVERSQFIKLGPKWLFMGSEIS